MKTRPSPAQRLLMALTASALLALAACGGGSSGPTASASAAPTSSAMSVSGTITGFGSVIIDGVRYDDTATSVSLDTNPAAPTAGTLADLKLGMRVEGTVTDGKLVDIVVHASLLGPIGTLDASNASFTVYGQTVKTFTSGATPTVFEGVQDFSGLVAGDMVEVHGTVDASKALNATRIERKPRADIGKGVRIGGVVTALDSTAKTFKFNDMTVDYGAAAVLPEGSTLTNGQLVVAWSDKLPGAGGFKAGAIKIVDPAEGVTFGVGGRIMSWASLADFTVSGVRIDASSATLEGGVAADLAAGVIVAAEGVVSEGVLKATSLRVLKTPLDVKASLSGAVTDWVSASSFKVRGAPVDASAATFGGGTAADLGNGALVLVTGKIQGDVLKADRVEFRNPPPAEPTRLKGEVREFDAAAGTFHFLGVTLRLGSSVVFVDGTLADLADGRRVQVTGTPDAAGVVVLTRVEFLGELAPQVSVVGGRIFDLTAGRFKLPGIGVSINDSTHFEGGSASDLANGVLVLAKGLFDPSSKTVVATWIEIVTLEAGLPRVAGTIGEFKSLADFRIGAQAIDASGATLVDATAAEFGSGAVVEAVGGVSEIGGVRVLQATRLRLLGK